MQVARNASILVAFRLAFNGAMAGAIHALASCPTIAHRRAAHKPAGTRTSAPAPAPTSTPTIRRVRYTAREEIYRTASEEAGQIGSGAPR